MWYIVVLFFHFEPIISIIIKFIINTQTRKNRALKHEHSKSVGKKKNEIKIQQSVKKIQSSFFS
jgi:ATP/ADP translocase